MKFSVDKNILYSILISWAVFLGSISSFLIGPNYRFISGQFVEFFLLSSFLFYTGFLITSSFIKLRIKPIFVAHKKIITIILWVGALCLLFRLIDRFHIRPFNEFSISSIRDSRKPGSNFFSVLSVFGFYFLIVLFDYSRNILKFRQKILIYAIFFILITDIALTGSRGIIVVTLIIILGHKLTLRNLIYLMAAFPLFFGSFFILRFLSLSGGNLSDILVNLSLDGYALFVPINTDLIQFLNSGDLYSVLLFSLVQLNQYAAHSFFEFAYIFNTQSFSCIDIGYYIPALSKIIDSCSTVDRTNLYYTLFGSSYISFGLYSPLSLFLSGLFLGFIYSRSIQIGFGSRNLVLYGLFLSMFVNSIGGFDLFIVYTCILLVSLIKFDNHYSTAPPISKSISSKWHYHKEFEYLK